MRENIADAFVKALEDGQSVAHSVAVLQKGVDADKFMKTATAVQKFSASREVKTIVEFMDSTGPLNPKP